MKNIYRNFLEIEDEIDDILKIEKDNKIYTPIDDKLYLRNIQKEYGTQNIVNIPMFDFFIERKFRDEKICYIIYNEDNKYFDIITEITEMGLRDKFPNIEFIKEEYFELYINNSIPEQSSMIIAINPNYETVFSIISLSITFLILCEKNEIYIENINNLCLKKYICFEKNKDKIKKIIESIYPGTKKRKIINRRIKIYDLIRESLKEKISLLNKLFISDRIYDNILSEYNSNNYNIIINYFSTNMKSKYDIFSFKNFENEIINISKENGIFFTFTLVDLFIMKRNVLYYPWIGLIEVTNIQDVIDLINSDTFIKSITNCYGLFILTNEIYDILKKLLKTYSLNIPLTIFRIPKIKNDITFDIEEFKNNPLLVNFGKRRLNMSILGIYGNNLELIYNNEIEEKDLYKRSVIVLTSDYPSPLGIFYNCICSETPIVLRKDLYFSKILGSDYPLFMDVRIEKYRVIEFLTEEKIEEAYSILKNIEYETFEEFIYRFKNSHYYDYLLGFE